MAIKIALIGAAGSMGTRAYNALSEDDNYELFCVESPAGEEALRGKGIDPVDMETAVKGADVALMTVPDILVGKISHAVVPHLQSGAMLIVLDPAAPYAGELPERDDVTYFATHPAHPPVFNDETDMEARRDFFGSGLASRPL